MTSPQNETTRHLQRCTAGRWLVWLGPSTGHYWAMPKDGDLLVEGTTPQRLVDRMREIDAHRGCRIDGTWL